MTNQLPLLPNDAPPPKQAPCNCKTRTVVYRMIENGYEKYCLSRCSVFGGCESWYLNGELLNHAEPCNECKGIKGYWIWRITDDIRQMKPEHIGGFSVGKCNYVPF